MPQSCSVISRNWPRPERSPLIERHQNGDRRIEAGAEIDERNAKAKRSGAGIAIDAHEPGHRLENGVVTRQPAQRTVSANPETRQWISRGKRGARSFS